MILYTPLAPEQVLSGWDDAPAPVVDIPMGNAILQVQPVDARRAKVVRLISPEAQAYLNPQLAPGAVIEWDYRFMP